MPPRGRPPGRKNGLAGRPQTAAGAGPRAKNAKRGKVGRPSKETTKATKEPSPDESAGREIHVASTPGEPDPVSVADHESDTQISVEDAAHESLNGAPSTAHEPAHPSSPGPDESNVVDGVSLVAGEVPTPAPAPAPTPASAPASAPAPASAVRLPNRSKPVNGTPGRAGAGRADNTRHGALGYTAPNVDLDLINYRQLTEDIAAYKVDLEFCNTQLSQDNLSPHEVRMLQLRSLDLSHQIRHSEHRKETLEAQRALSGGRPLSAAVLPAAASAHGRRTVPSSAPKRPLPASAGDRNGSASVSDKRPRAGSEISVQDTISMHSINSQASSPNAGAVDPNNDLSVEGDGLVNDGLVNGSSDFAKPEDDELSAVPGRVRRLGFWKCRLCVSEKYIHAGPDRLPNAPSKWPLKDMGKLMSHYFDLHTEHDPEERCAELGDALDNNRGPFEHWLRKSRGQKISDPAIIDQVIWQLQAGTVPKLLRDLCRAAAAFPGA